MRAIHVSVRVIHVSVRVIHVSVCVAPIHGALSHANHGNCAY